MTRLTRPNRSNVETLCAAALVTLIGVAPLACGPADAPASGQDQAASQAASQAADLARGVEAPAPVSVVPSAPAADGEAILASASATPSATPTASASTPSASAPSPAAVSPRERPADSFRHPSLLPAGTPELNVAAFTNLPLAKRDKAPIAGAGASGIHLDELAVGAGWASSRCEDLSERFTVDVDERVNVCFRVVHPRVDEAVTVEWAKNGQLRQSIRVNVKATHAYLSRAWMPVSGGRAGDWSATIKSEDGTVLGEVAFNIAP